MSGFIFINSEGKFVSAAPHECDKRNEIIWETHMVSDLNKATVFPVPQGFDRPEDDYMININEELEKMFPLPAKEQRVVTLITEYPK